uniref:Uncharacterized protein n=1 Tax=viral metagenome TaxID=1070528 RepID=A0A6C0LV88_9ZZZZ
MGKKERDIKQKNKEYWNDMNSQEIANNKFIADENRRHEKMNIEEKKTRLFEDMTEHIGNTLREYSNDEGLPLCETLDSDNLTNYIKYIISGRSTITKPKKETPQEETPKETVYDSLLEQKYIQSKQRLEETKTRIDKFIFSLGEGDLKNEWLKEKHTQPVNLQRRLRDKFGDNKYEDLVMRIGTHLYERL